MTSVASTEAFFKSIVKDCQPVIIYGAIDALRPSIPQSYKVIDNSRSISVLRNLEKNQVVVQSQPALMRGYDYRTSHPSGLLLLLTYACPEERDLYQIMGRVGRQGEICGRYFLEGVTLVNHHQKNIIQSLEKVGLARKPDKNTK